MSKKFSFTTPCPAWRRASAKPCRLSSNSPGDSGEAIGAVIDREHSRHDGEKNLGGANVARGLVAPDVLLAGLQGQAVGGVAIGVLETPMRRPGIWRSSPSRTAR